MKPAFLLAIAMFAATFILSAQFGQILEPIRPANNPGRNPNGGSGVPGDGSRRTTREEKPAGHTEVVSGVVRKVDADSFELEAEDTRFLIIQFSSSVPKPADLRVGDGLDVTAQRGRRRHVPSGQHETEQRDRRTINRKRQHRSRAGAPRRPEPGRLPPFWSGPDATPDGDDSGPPKLKRGKPVERASAAIPVIRRCAAAGHPDPQAGSPAPAIPTWR